ALLAFIVWWRCTPVEFVKKPLHQVFLPPESFHHFFAKTDFMVIHNIIGVHHQDQVIEKVHLVVVVVGDDNAELLLRINQFLNLSFFQSVSLADLEQKLYLLLVNAAVGLGEREEIPYMIFLVRKILMFKETDHGCV